MSFCGGDIYWQSIVPVVLKTLKSNQDKFDMFVCQGLSGQCYAFLAAHTLKIPLLILRKTNGEEHSKRASGAYGETGLKRLLEGWQFVRDWNQHNKNKPRVCFIDDTLGSGNTRHRCGNAIFKAGGIVTCQVINGSFSLINKEQQKLFEKGDFVSRSAAMKVLR